MVMPLLRAVRRAPERLLHRVRHRRALSRLAHRSPLRFVLVMCYGNICRSPFAAARLSEGLQPLGIRVESAGLYGPGRPTPRAGIEAARARGIDLSGHRSRLVTSELVRDADLIIVMDSLQARTITDRFAGQPEKVVLLGDLDPLPIRTRRIHDPEAQPVAVFSEVYARVERCVSTLARALGARPVHA
jgi:protein-tyrosine phosphatase